MGMQQAMNPENLAENRRTIFLARHGQVIEP